MPGRVNPEDFFDRLDDYDRRLADLERSGGLTRSGIAVTPSAAGSGNAKGTIIVDGSLAERVRLGATDTDASPAAAQGLYGASAKDGSGVVRALFGQTDTGYGVAAFAADGSKIFDSNGLVAVVKSAASATRGGTLVGLAPSVATFADIDTSLVTPSFTVPAGRTISFLALAQVSTIIKLPTTTNTSFLNVRLVVRGSGGGALQKASQQCVSISLATQYYAPSMAYCVATLGAGTYEAALQMRTGGGASNVTSVDVSDGQMDVFQLGG